MAACLRAQPLERGTWRTELKLFARVDALARFRAEEQSEAPVCIDVPIGLLESVDYRSCDRQARRILGRARAASVFMPPARYMLPAAGDYAAIRALVERRRGRDPTAKSLSAQAAGIAPKVREVDAWVRAHPESERWLFECHPELSFHALAGGPLADAKSSPAGRLSRLSILRPLFPDCETRISTAPWPATQVGMADLLDAYAALSTALACARGVHSELGDGERDREGLPMRMVF